MLVDFYHLGASPLERVLPAICEKLIAGGERLLVVAGPDQLERIDRDLWTYSPDSFLPHGRSGGPSDQAEPVLLSSAVEAANGARKVALADGVWRDEALGFERVFYFFDGSAIEAARASWRALKGRAEVEARYWKQDERGKWVQGP